MNLRNVIETSISHSVVRIFSTMLGAEVRQGGVSIETGAPEANDGVVSLIGIAGTWVGTGSIKCSPSLACRICSQLLMTECASVDEDVLDAVAELTNMVVGNVKTDLETHLGPLGLSIPTVVFGRNFKTRSAGHAEWIVSRFVWGDEVLIVKLCLTRNERAGDGKAAETAAHSREHPLHMDV
jgi:chemotaxis protein CheX